MERVVEGASGCAAARGGGEQVKRSGTGVMKWPQWCVGCENQAAANIMSPRYPSWRCAALPSNAHRTLDFTLLFLLLFTREVSVPKRSTEDVDLALDHSQAGSSNRSAVFDAGLKVEDGHHIIPKPGV